MSERMSKNSTILPTWSVAMPACCLGVAFLVSLAATALGAWSIVVAAGLTTVGLSIVALTGLRGDGLFGGTALGSWLLLVFAVWPLGSVLISSGISGSDQQQSAVLVVTYPLLAGAFYLVALAASWLAARSIPQQPVVRYANTALFGAIIVTLASSWMVALVNATRSMVFCR